MSKKKLRKEDEDKDAKQEELLRQVRLIHGLATRLPWILAGVSLLAFLIIFLQVLLG